MNKKVIASAIGSVAGLFLLPTGAGAHHPEITASATCADSGNSFVNINVQSWLTDEPGHRVNNNVIVQARDPQIQDVEVWVTVASGKFTAENGFKFTALISQPTALGKVDLKATALVPFGPNGEFGSAGEFRTTSVTLPTGCTTPTTTTPRISTTNDTIPPTTTTTATPADNITIERNPVPAVPVETTPKFAG